MKLLKKIFSFLFKKEEKFLFEKILYIIKELIIISKSSKGYNLLSFSITFKEISKKDMEKIKNELDSYKNLIYNFEEKNKVFYLNAKIK